MRAAPARGPSVQCPPMPLTRWQQTWRNMVAIGSSARSCGSRRPGRQWHRWHWLPAVIDLSLGVLASFVLMQFRRRWPWRYRPGHHALFSRLGDLAGSEHVITFVSLSTRRRWTEIISIGLVSVACGSGVLLHSQPRAAGHVVTSTSCCRRRHHGGRRRDRHVHRCPPRAARQPAGPRRAGRARAGAQGGHRAGRRAHPDRARDARRARPPDVARGDARRRARLPRRPDAGGDPRRRGVIQSNSHRALSDLREILGVLRDQERGDRCHGPPSAAHSRATSTTWWRTSEPRVLIDRARSRWTTGLRYPSRSPAARTGSCRRA